MVFQLIHTLSLLMTKPPVPLAIADRLNAVFGYSASNAGDVNGDGLDDLIIGAKSVSPNNNAHAGKSYVIFGNTPL
jgi:hypothetical protein